MYIKEGIIGTNNSGRFFLFFNKNIMQNMQTLKWLKNLNVNKFKQSKVNCLMKVIYQLLHKNVTTNFHASICCCFSRSRLWEIKFWNCRIIDYENYKSIVEYCHENFSCFQKLLKWLKWIQLCMYKSYG